MTWAGAVVTMAVGTLAAGATLLGVWLTMRHTTREREAAERRVQRERVANLIARVDTWLVDLQPGRTVGAGRFHLVRELADQWDGMRVELAAVALTDPAPEMRRLISLLSLQLERAIGSQAAVVAAATQAKPEAERRAAVEEAINEHLTAVVLAHRAGELWRGDSSLGSDVTTGAPNAAASTRSGGP